MAWRLITKLRLVLVRDWSGVGTRSVRAPRGIRERVRRGEKCMNCARAVDSKVGMEEIMRGRSSRRRLQTLTGAFITAAASPTIVPLWLLCTLDNTSTPRYHCDELEAMTSTRLFVRHAAALCSGYIVRDPCFPGLFIEVPGDGAP